MLSPLDYILFAFFLIALVAAFIRGLKHPQTRFEGDLFAFILAFFLAIVIHGFLLRYQKPADWETAFASYLGDFKSFATWIVAGLIFLVLLLILIPFFRFLYRHNGLKRGATFFLTLFTYLLLAYLAGFILTITCIEAGNATLANWYSASLVASKIYPDVLTTWTMNIAKGVI
jgi:phosphatidylglycerophosphate synthase